MVSAREKVITIWVNRRITEAFGKMGRGRREDREAESTSEGNLKKVI